MVFGSGVAGLSVLTHTHTPPWLTSKWKKKPLRSLTQTFILSTPVLNTHALPIRVLSVGCSSSCKDHIASIILTHRYSSVLNSHRQMGTVHFHPRSAVLLWSSLGFGTGVCSFHAQFGSRYFSLPQRGLCMLFLTNSWPVHMFSSAQL